MTSAERRRLEELEKRTKEQAAEINTLWRAVKTLTLAGFAQLKADEDVAAEYLREVDNEAARAEATPLNEL